MKILYIYSDMISLNDIPWGLLELDEYVENYDKLVTMEGYNEREKNELSLYLKNTGFDAVIMHNFSGTVSEACRENNVKYISWVFDSPVWNLYDRYAHNSCNYIFVFDKKQYLRLQKKGFLHLFYIPLAANVSRASGLCITEEEEKKYGCDISFVGRLYRDNEYNRDSSQLPDMIREYFNHLIISNSLKWDKENSPIGSIERRWYQGLQEWIKLPLEEEEDRIYFMEVCYLCRKLAEIERVCILNALALSEEVHLYTFEDPKDLEGVIVHPRVEYATECPKIFHLSKINLNITLRSIESGIPQRVFDIMSVGGFVLSNYQEEMEELFVPDKEIVFFHNMEELIYKVKYYLCHEEERVKIAMNGYQKVKKYYSYPVTLKKMLKMIEGESDEQ